MTFALYRADARALPLADASVDLIVTSPPYFALRSYQDECPSCGGTGSIPFPSPVSCPVCDGTGNQHYEGQIGSEGTPAEFLTALWAVLDECWRVLKPSGSCFVNLGDKFSGSGGANDNSGLLGKVTDQSSETDRYSSPRRYNRNAGGIRPKSRMLLPHRFALGAIDPDYRAHMEGRFCRSDDMPDYHQWVCRMDIVWAKPNGLPESVTDRVRASHEYWFHLTRSERYFAAVDEVREEYAPTSLERSAYPQHTSAKARMTMPGETRDAANQDWSPSPLGKLPGSVWTIPSEPLRVPDHLPQHFAAFPSEWPKRLIAGWSPTGICTRCDEGRRPVVEPTPEYAALRGPGTDWNQRDRKDGNGARGRVVSEHTLTGYSCACPQPDAPTRPAVVLDPFCGTGTTVAVAHHLGRHGIGIDLSADYLRLAQWRCTQDWTLREKVTGSRPVTTDPNQMELFA